MKLKLENTSVRELDNHIFFFSGGTLLSNFKPSLFKVDGVNYTHAEQYIQQQKALLFKRPDVAKEFMTATIPIVIKNLVSKLPTFDPKLWEEKSPDIGYTAVLHKFRQNPELLKDLISTRDKTLVEAAPYDRVWGIGFHKDDGNIITKKRTWGKNLQGGNLMRVRSELSALIIP